MKPIVGVVASLLGAGMAMAADKPLTLDVWSGPAPGEVGKIEEEKLVEGKPGQRTVKRLTNVSKPTLTVFKPAADKDTGAAVLICPGGGYNILAWDLEGEEVAAWLNSIGVTGVVLKYRVPRRGKLTSDGQPIAPLQDAQRALRLVRSKAKEWGIDPDRIGILGFSAGGHLSAAVATNFDQCSYEPMDDVDKLSSRPDYAVLVYPAYLLSKDNLQLTPHIRVSKDTPPTFFAHASDDRILPDNSVQMYLALRRAGVPAELHIYAQGGHGFGLRPSEQPCSTWPARCAEWLKAQGILEKKTVGK
ncbi:MAG: alpha/beta hydrolase [Gemmataceae bacterium]